MNSFFKQLLGSLVQIGINELSKAKDQGNKDQITNDVDCSNKTGSRRKNRFRQGDDEGTDEIDLSGHRSRE